MDPRQPHPFSRPQERTERNLIQNPNHQQAAPQPQHVPYSSYGPPPTSQPPVHVPFADPFQRRADPFLPNAQSQRRGSYGMPGRENIASMHSDRAPLNGGWGSTSDTANVPAPPTLHQSSGPPAPPPLDPAHTSSAPLSYPFDSARRRSVGGGSPPRYYGVNHDPPPPPPTFGNRHMPPPSSPQQQNPPHSQTPRAPSSTPFSTGRDLPGLSSLHRPGSSMSISSLIGGDSNASHQPRHSPPTSSTVPSPSTRTMQPPSPRRAGPPLGSRDFGAYRRPETPDRYPTSRAPEPPSYGAGSPPRSNPARSPEQLRQGLPQGPHHYKSSSLTGSRLYQSSPNDSRDRDIHRQNGFGVPPRPNSQPTSTLGPQRDGDPKMKEDPFARHSNVGNSPVDRRQTLDGQYQSRPGTSDANDRMSQGYSSRERPVTVQPVSQSAYNPPKDQQSPPGPQTVSQSQHHRDLFWNPMNRQEPNREPPHPPREEIPEYYRSGARGPPPTQPPSSAAPGSDHVNRYSQPLDRFGPRMQDHYQAPPTSEPHNIDRRRFEDAAALSASGSSGPQQQTSITDMQSRRYGDDIQRERSFLNVSPEATRRAGRASPLPQAVQGAQAQPVGPGGDPGIKSEFGRMFSGLGSGLGSGPTGNGTSTPSRQSPLPQGVPDQLPSGGPVDAEGYKMSRTASSRSRKSRRVKDEDERRDSEGGDGRGTPSLMNPRANKRTKHNHPNTHPGQQHHHHHYPQSHHHHHHHHKPDDEFVSPVTSHPAQGTASTFNNPKFGTALPSSNMSTPTTHHHHHHHHHPAPHHHHHVPRTSLPVNMPSPKTPVRNINNQLLLASVANLPRNHLGSHLYQQVLGLPPAKAPLDASIHYAGDSKPLPLFEGKENCTLTIRVPRYYLTSEQREQICARKFVWGSDAYTDDSDPVAAAIHAGWIRGEWPADIDATMILGQQPDQEAAEVPEIMETPPMTGPVLPPPDLDLHITVLILPPLEAYASTVRFGLKSRSWGDNHDGMSFMIQKLEWVDEGHSRGYERSGEARRKRLQAAMSLMSLLTGERDTNRKIDSANRGVEATA